MDKNTPMPVKVNPVILNRRKFIRVEKLETPPVDIMPQIT
jgi:hypothetical protein